MLAAAVSALGESLLELPLQALRGDVVLRIDMRLDLRRKLEGLRLDEIDVTKHALAIGMVVAVTLR